MECQWHYIRGVAMRSGKDIVADRQRCTLRGVYLVLDRNSLGFYLCGRHVELLRRAGVDIHDGPLPS